MPRTRGRGDGYGGLGAPRLSAGGVADAGSAVASLVPVAAAVIAAAAAGGAVALAVRRLAGGFTSPPPGGAWVVAAAGIALVAAADLVAGRSVAAWVARGGLAVAVAAVGLPFPAHDLASWAAVAITAAVCLVPPARGAMHHVRVAAEPRDVLPPRRRPRRPATAPRPKRDRHRDADVPGRLVQRLERYDAPPDHDCLRGRVNLAIPSGGRGTHAHVGFCPAFAETPSVRVTTDYDGVEAVVSAAEVLPWGVRVECRLAEPAEEPLEIPVDVFVQARR
jgi:hypothetical protein